MIVLTAYAIRAFLAAFFELVRFVSLVVAGAAIFLLLVLVLRGF